MKKLLLILLIWTVPSFGQQILDVKRGSSVTYSWAEVTTDTSGGTLKRSEVYYQMYAAPFVDDIPQWVEGIQVKLFEEDWQPMSFDSSRVEVVKSVTLTDDKYQLVLTAYRYDSDGNRHESDPSLGLIIFNMENGTAPPVKPGNVTVQQKIN